MRHQPPNPISASTAPTTEDMLRVWRADRCVQSSSAGLYLQWIRRFRSYCAQRKLDERDELTLAGVHRFVVWYAGTGISIRGGSVAQAPRYTR